MQLDERIGRRLKLRDLNIFLAVVKARSMSKAAAALAISQPAVSKSVADLEYTLGASLLDRTLQGIEPTPYGEALLKRGLAVFDELRQSVKDIESLLDPTIGEVRVGCASPLAAVIVANVIQRLSSRYPRVLFHTVEGDFTALKRELDDRNIELAIGPVQGPIAEENLKSEFLFFDRLVVVAGSKSRWLRQKNLKLPDLLNERWILPHGILSESLIVEAFRTIGASAPRATVSSRSPRLNDFLLATGNFLSLFPESMIGLSGKRLPFKVLPVEFPSPPRTVVIVTLDNRTLSPVARLFIECVRDIAKPLASSNGAPR